MNVVDKRLVPISAVLATKNRPDSLRRTLESLSHQSTQPGEIIVIDASDDHGTEQVCVNGIPGLDSNLRWLKAAGCGAAIQRNEGVGVAQQRLIWFFDDDIVFEDGCVARLWLSMGSNPRLGGANAMIVNQCYEAPGFVSRIMFSLMHGRHEKSFAGKLIGPAINLLPEDREDLPEVVPVEWLNTTCTMYRREALPDPPFDPFFEGYSLMEDLALSLTVAKRGWKLANVRTARIIHNSQPGAHKDDVVQRSAMELRNRLYVMEELLRQNEMPDYLRLLLWELFGLVSSLTSRDGARHLLPSLRGKLQALRDRHGARGR